MDAFMSGDKNRIAKIQAELKQKAEEISPKNKHTTIQINTVLNDDNASAIKIYNFLNKTIGEDWWELEFETLERLLWIKYGVALEDINRDKIWAIRHVCNSDRPFADWYEFNQCAISFAGSIADFTRWRSPSTGMAINAVKTLNHIRPDRNSEFSNDVLKYICIISKEDGIYVPAPSIAMMIHDKMAKMTSPAIRAKWMDVLRRYKSIVSRNVKEFEENIVDIQAKRLVRAESAAYEYGAR